MSEKESSMGLSDEITIVGGGLAGSLMAIMLGKNGFTVHLYEKRPDMREIDTDGGRSINLALSHRGLNALEAVGLRSKVQHLLIPMRGRKIHDPEGNLSFQPYGKDETEVINSISRQDLNKLLLNEAQSLPNVNLYFNYTCKGYDNRANTLHMEDNNGNYFTLNPAVIIAADGANSAVRNSMLKMGRFNYSQTYLDYGYKEIEIPPHEGGGFRIDPNSLHIWPRKQFLMIALANPDGSFTTTLFAPFDGEFGMNQLVDETSITNYFRAHFPDVMEHLPNLVEDYLSNPTGNLVTIRCNPWTKGNAVLIGDAAHAIIPFYGQGMNAAFEDCLILSGLIGQNVGSNHWKEIFKEFSRIRKPDADAIADLSYDNFVEMRDNVADQVFLERKAAEVRMYERYDQIISKYAMVTFHPEIPYHIAKLKGDILEETIENYYIEHGTLEDDDLDKIKAEVLEAYSKIEHNS